MFDLEQSIAEWRRQMLAAGIKTPAPLEELESHLREEIERQMRLGADKRQAFESAGGHIGEVKALDTEFKKVNAAAKGKQVIRTSVILAALFGTVLGGAMLLPALGRWHQTGVFHLGPFLRGTALAMVAAGAAVYGVRTYQGVCGRRLIGYFTIAAGCFYMVPLIQAFFIPRTDSTGWAFCALLAAASLAFYGSCLHSIRSFPDSELRKG